MWARTKVIGHVGKNGMSTMPQSSGELHWSRAETVRQAILRLGLVKNWRGDLVPDAIGSSDRRYIILSLVESDGGSGWSFNKEALVDIAEFIGSHHQRRMNNYELRQSIATECGFEFDAPNNSDFRKGELGQVLVEIVKEEFEEAK